MLKKLLLLFILLTGSFFFFNTNQTSAESVCHINHCFIPAPTIVVPENDLITTEKRPVVRGLTWKRTLVDIYLDGQYQDSVLLKEHEDHLQSFFWQPSNDLTAGEHYIYTVAYNSRGYDKNLKGWDQSKESAYIYFTIIEEKNILVIEERAGSLPKQSILSMSGQEKQTTTSEQIFSNNFESIVSDEPATPIKNIAEEEAQKKKQKNLRIFGLIILIAFIIILIVNHYLKRKREYLKGIIKEVKIEKGDDDKYDNDYPPPPPPINQDSLGI